MVQNMSLSNSSAPLAQGAFNSHALGGVDVQVRMFFVVMAYYLYVSVVAFHINMMCAVFCSRVNS